MHLGHSIITSAASHNVPNRMPSLTGSLQSVRDTESHHLDERDFLNELEVSAEDDIPSWLAKGG